MELLNNDNAENKKAIDFKTVQFEKLYKQLKPNITTTVQGVQFFNSSSTEADNSAFQKMNDLYRMSSVQSYFCNLKASLIRASGIFPEDENDKATLEFLSRKNRAGENMYQIWDRNCSDMGIYDCSARQVIYNQDREIAEVYYTSPVNLRASMTNDIGCIDHWFFSTTWGEITNETDRRNYNDIKNATIIPSFNPTSLEDDRQVQYTKKHSPIQETYAFPQYLTAENFIRLEYYLSEYVATKVLNGFFPSGVFYLNTTLSPEQQSEFVRDFKRKHEGTSNAGKIIFVFGDSSQSKPEFVQLNDSLGDSMFKDFIGACHDAISMAHGGSQTLLGIEKGGSDLGGDANRLNISRLAYIEDVIKPYQTALLDNFNAILEHNGLGRVTVINKGLKLQQPIVSQDTLTVDEQREMAYGLPPIPKATEPTQPITEDKPPVL